MENTRSSSIWGPLPPRIGVRTPGIHGIAAECWENFGAAQRPVPLPRRLGESEQRLDRSGLGAAPSQMSPFALLYPDAAGHR